MKIFFGDDRVRIERCIKRELGENYEVFDGVDIDSNELNNIFLGNSLFCDKRKILIKDLGENKECFSKLTEYAGVSDRDVIVFETKLDKRTAIYKELKKAGVEMDEFKLAEPVRNNEVFDIFDFAFAGNGARAVKMIEKIEKTQDPFMFFGLLATQAVKKYEARQGSKEKRALKELSKLDNLMKSSSIEPWTLIKMTILKLA